MRLNHLKIGWIMTTKELIRKKIILILLFVIPTVFYTITRITTTNNLIPFRLASVSEETFLWIPQRQVALIFIGLAAVGLLSSFLALNLIQRSTEVNRRIIICGYRSQEIALSKLLVLFCVIILVGFYVAAMLLVFFKPIHFLQVAYGFIMVGFVYGCYGLLVGAVLKGELEGILFIVLLANIDVGWLQNPIFYAEALNKTVIRTLPAFYPSQISIISAFSDHSIMGSVLGGAAYGCLFLFIALLLYWLKMRKHN